MELAAEPRLGGVQKVACVTVPWTRSFTQDSMAHLVSTSSNGQFQRKDSTSARTGSTPGLSLRKRQSRLCWIRLCTIKPAITPACASEDLPTPELPRRTVSLSDASASITSRYSES